MRHEDVIAITEGLPALVANLKEMLKDNKERIQALGVAVGTALQHQQPTLLEKLFVLAVEIEHTFRASNLTDIERTRITLAINSAAKAAMDFVESEESRLIGRNDGRSN